MRIFTENQVFGRMMLIFVFFILLIPINLIGQTTPLLGMADVGNLPYDVPDTIIHYGEDSFNFAELRMPKEPHNQTYPLIVIIHGGCWLSAVANADFMQGYSSALTKEGYATYNIEYRSADHPSGGWPNTFNDVVAAVNKIPELKKNRAIDLSNIVIIGHSAGGHLALWTALSRSIKGDCNECIELQTAIKGVISLAGIVDMKDYYDPSGQSCGRGVAQLLGGSPDEYPDRYLLTSPTRFDLSNNTNNISLITGALDPIVPVEHVNLLGELYPEIEHFIIPESGHFEMVIPKTTAWDKTLDVIKGIID